LCEIVHTGEGSLFLVTGVHDSWARQEEKRREEIQGIHFESPIMNSFSFISSSRNGIHGDASRGGEYLPASF